MSEMTVVKKRSLIALILSVILMLSFFTVGVFAETETETVVETEAEETTEAVTEKEEQTTTAHDHDHDHEEEDNTTELIINLVIGGVILVIAVVLIIKFREKLAKFLRSVKSELGKIVWASKEQTKKNFLVVIVIVALIALLIFILDFAFSKGIMGLADVVGKLFDK